jgi:hypothetical protein
MAKAHMTFGQVHLKSTLIRGVAFDDRGLIRVELLYYKINKQLFTCKINVIFNHRIPKT